MMLYDSHFVIQQRDISTYLVYFKTVKVSNCISIYDRNYQLFPLKKEKYFLEKSLLYIYIEFYIKL